MAEDKRPLGGPRRRWEDKNKLDLKKTGIDVANWIIPAPDMIQWDFVNTLMKLLVP
jgi:hypothetical protein